MLKLVTLLLLISTAALAKTSLCQNKATENGPQSKNSSHNCRSSIDTELKESTQEVDKDLSLQSKLYTANDNYHPVTKKITEIKQADWLY